MHRCGAPPSVAAVKVPLPLDKRAWHPSVLPGQIVLVTTVDGDGVVNVAPKSWLTMVALEEPVLAFGCNTGHATFRNLLAAGEFVVNVLAATDVEEAWAIAGRHGADRRAHSRLTFAPARRVAPPLVAECRAHLECELDDVKFYGDEILVFGRVVSASIDEECLAGDIEEQYTRLDPAFFLEDGTYAALGPARRAG
jgi:flavin reductase (DIM6/NTAB) family NADH-FMN oxidoreductase RutF